MHPSPAPDRHLTHAAQARSFPVLDGLRGVAAVAIAVRHAPFLWATPGSPTGLLRESYLAVDLFFVLSGFVLEHAYRARIDGGLAPLAFMRMRLVRLYPLYGLALACSVAGLWLTGRLGEGAGWRVATAAAFLPTPASNPTRLLFPLNYPAWSLFFELLINLVFVATGRRLSGSVLCLAVGGSGAMLWWGVLGGHAGFAGDLNAGATWGGFLAGFLRVAFGYFLGVLAYRVWKAGRRMPTMPPVLLIACLAAVLACGPPEPWRAMLDLVAVTLVFPALVILSAQGAADERRGGRLMRWLGATSYAVYVLQAPVFFGAATLFGGASTSTRATTGVATLLALVPVSHLATTLFDAPARRFLRRIAIGTTGRDQTLGRDRSLVRHREGTA